MRARGLRKQYGGTVAVACFDAEVAEGTVLGFLGPNGAGKTTVIRMLSTILTPDEGTFEVAGIPADRSQEIRQWIGVLPESAGYPLAQTGAEWLRFHGQLFGLDASEARDNARLLLAEVGLAERGDTLVAGYSRGMRQRLGIARALVNSPRVVFLDEPTLGLDPMGQAQVLQLVVRIARQHGVTVVLSTHSLDEVEQVCDRVLILNRGRVVADGTVADVARRAAAPRQGVVKVRKEDQPRAVQVLREAGVAAQAREGNVFGDVEVLLDPGSDDASRVLALLLTDGVAVLGLTLEGGRLSDAFLALTAEA